MKSQTLNVFILNDDIRIADKLKHFLEKRFGHMMNVSLFFNSESFFSKLTNNVDLVVVDDYLYDANTKTNADVVDIVKKVKAKCTTTEVVVLSSDEDIETAVNAINMGAKGFIPNRYGAWSKLQYLVYHIASSPIRFIVKEFGVSKFVAIFIMTFLTVGVVVLIALKMMHTI